MLRHFRCTGSNQVHSLAVLLTCKCNETGSQKENAKKRKIMKDEAKRIRAVEAERRAKKQRSPKLQVPMAAEKGEKPETWFERKATELVESFIQGCTPGESPVCQVPQGLSYLLLPFRRKQVVGTWQVLLVRPDRSSSFPFIFMHLLTPFFALHFLCWLHLGVRSPKRSRLGTRRAYLHQTYQHLLSTSFLPGLPASSFLSFSLSPAGARRATCATGR